MERKSASERMGVRQNAEAHLEWRRPTLSRRDGRPARKRARSSCGRRLDQVHGVGVAVVLLKPPRRLDDAAALCPGLAHACARGLETLSPGRWQLHTRRRRDDLSRFVVAERAAGSESWAPGRRSSPTWLSRLCRCRQNLKQAKQHERERRGRSRSIRVRRTRWRQKMQVDACGRLLA